MLICAGGTGGGVYPAVVVLKQLMAGSTPPEVLWVGGEGGMEAELVTRAGIPYQAIPAAGVHGVGLRTLPGNLLQLLRGVFSARKILRSFRPDLLFFTGGYVAVPMAVAGLRVPSVLYVPDIEPGLALKTLARFSDTIAVTAEESREYFPSHDHVMITGYPTRKELSTWALGEARKALNLVPDLPTLLVFGGSKGARSINRALFSVLPDLLAEIQIIHISGKLNWPEVETVQQTLTADLAKNYHAYPYLHAEMGAAFTAADLVLSRAGASSLGEFPLFELPAILVPYPYAWRYQKVNANYLVKHGAAVLVKDADLPGRILPLVRELLQSNQQLTAMSAAMKKLAYPHAALSIVKLLQNLVPLESALGSES